MPKPTRGARLGAGPAHERLLLANLATSLFKHGRITTTEAKAKRVRPLAERMVTFAKRGDLHARRQVATVVRDKDVAYQLFSEIAPRFATRPGGYTRIVKVGPRKGDAAPMAVIELVEELATAPEPRRRSRSAVQKEAVEALAPEESETEAVEETVEEPVAEADTAEEPEAKAEEKKDEE